MNIEFKWQASDGYIGGHRPQLCRIDLDELAECETEKEVEDLVEVAVRDDFEQKVSPSWNDTTSQRLLDKGNEQQRTPTTDTKRAVSVLRRAARVAQA